MGGCVVTLGATLLATGVQQIFKQKPLTLTNKAQAAIN